MSTHWRLPRGVDEILPPLAWDLEVLRRRTLDVFVSRGYDYIEPPVIEYLDALLVGSGEDLDLQTLKVIDQSSGRQLGVRADMTSQAVRIDSHSRVTDSVQRLCYAGTVVYASAQSGQNSRVPLKAGAEIFGAQSLSADAEVVSLMLDVVSAADIAAPVLLLGHMGIYRGLVAQLVAAKALDEAQLPELFARVQRKGESDIRDLVGDSDAGRMMAVLPSLMGDIAVLERARSVLQGASGRVLGAIEELAALAGMIQRDYPDLDLRIDVSELSGYGYHNGAVFAVYHPQHGQALAQGGRYDGVGEVFGRARPATGFDTNLKQLLAAQPQGPSVYFAPFVDADERGALMEFVRKARTSGHRIAVALDRHEQAPERCAGTLEQRDGQWCLPQ